MENKIISRFLYNDKLKFSEIEKALNERSNKIAYHIKNLVKKDILVKEKDSYKLSKAAENLIPYISTKKHMLPTVLIHIGNEKECFIIERKKKPFKGLLGLPGGRIILKENISDSVKRIMKEKYNIEVKLKKINSISIEHIKNDEEIIQSDLVIFITATANRNLKLTNIEDNKKKIIKSDYKLIKRHLNKEVKIERFLTAN
jgi:ADP-ribose pyrophosphatase YjhB (NUDIX family)|tara:strand:- start:15 stop:617 length:603 start_codon:yes stop_codon:yes gene_type:complete